ncbi:MAG: 50S ribosomal protein L23 [Deltaproteobacteria bacterium]|nr:50S ribosomal protein L23 [Deltaproteobacteria bacterium]
MNAYAIIRRPLITEKGTRLKDTHNQYVFEVLPDANKVEIARAIEKIFKVTVKDVQTLNVNGKVKRRGRTVGKKRDWKKAVVRLAQGASIEFFDGV